MTTKTIYGPADVAEELGVSRQLMSHYINHRYGRDDTPAPVYSTRDGRAFWDAAGVKAWRTWLKKMKADK